MKDKSSTSSGELQVGYETSTLTQQDSASVTYTLSGTAVINLPFPAAGVITSTDRSWSEWIMKPTVIILN